MADVEHAGAAMRRRQRRLRQWHRHERMTVAMALAEATHHAAPRGPKTARAGEGVEHEQHDGLRALKPPLPGVRPGSLCDPGPQRSDRTVRHSAGGHSSPGGAGAARPRRRRRHHPPFPPRAELVAEEEARGGGEGEEVARTAEGDEGGVHGAHGPPEPHSSPSEQVAGARGGNGSPRCLQTFLRFLRFFEEEEEEEEEEKAPQGSSSSFWCCSGTRSLCPVLRNDRDMVR